MNNLKMEGPYLGYGLMRMPVKGNNLDEMACEALIDEYMKGNFCYFDTHPNYLHGQSHNIIKRYIVEKYERNRYLIADKMPYYVNCPKDYEKIFDHSLFECGLDYFDYYLLHALTKKIYELHEHLGGIEFLKQKKLKEKLDILDFRIMEMRSYWMKFYAIILKWTLCNYRLIIWIGRTMPYKVSYVMKLQESMIRRYV